LCWADLLRVLVPGIALGLVLGWVVSRRQVHLRRMRPSSWIRRARLMGAREWAELIALSITVALVSLLISLKIGEAMLSAGIEMYSPEEFPFVGLMNYPVIMLLAVNLLPVFEEWIFRGIVIDELRRSTGSTALAVTASTLSFAVFHLTNPGTYIWYAIPLIPCGILLSLLYLRVGLGGAILAHSAYNTLLFLLSL
jgi:membrane protease YdiL (CAAX protease family)